MRKATRFGYYIDLDERGDFYADVRDVAGRTVFEIRAGDLLDPDESSIFEDGFMRHKSDLKGLTDYLRDLGVIGTQDQVVPASDFEADLPRVTRSQAPG